MQSCKCLNKYRTRNVLLENKRIFCTYVGFEKILKIPKIINQPSNDIHVATT